MQQDDMDQEIARDPVLGAALRWADGDAPQQEVEWEELRRNIRERAAFSLAQRRTRGRTLGRWMRPLVPLAAAASVALAVWVGGLGRSGPTLATDRAGFGEAAYSTEETLFTELSEQEFRNVLSGRDDPEELLMIAAAEN